MNDQEIIAKREDRIRRLCERITDLEAQLAAQARIFEEVNKLFEGIRSGITGSMGSINNVYLPQLGRESIDSLHESIKGLHESIKAAVPKQEK